MSDILLRTDKVTRIIPDIVPVTLVRDISVEIRAGEFISIVGASGSGKSSLLYLLGLLDAPTSGEIYLKGVATNNLSSAKKSQMRLSQLGFVFQFHFLLPEFTVFENILLPMRKLGRLSDYEMKERAHSLFTDLGIDDQTKKRPEQLSGGQRQRVAIARALANDPDIILADEPTGNLDSKNATIVFDIFRDLVEQKGKTIIAVTHDTSLADCAGRQIHMIDGKISG